MKKEFIATGFRLREYGVFLLILLIMGLLGTGCNSGRARGVNSVNTNEKRQRKSIHRSATHHQNQKPANIGRNRSKKSSGF